MRVELSMRGEHFFLPPEPRDNQAPELERLKSQEDKASSVLRGIKSSSTRLVNYPIRRIMAGRPMVTLRDKKEKIEAAMRSRRMNSEYPERAEIILEIVRKMPLCGRGSTTATRDMWKGWGK